MSKDINVDIMNMLLRHQHFVRAYENSILRTEILPILLRAKIDMERRLRSFGKQKGLNNLSKLTKYEKKLLEQKIKEIDLVIKQANDKISGALDKNLSKFAKEVEKINIGFINNALPIAISLNRIPIERLKYIIDQPLGGKKYAKRLEDNYKQAVNIIKREIAIGIASGKSMKQVSNKLVGIGKSLGGLVGEVLTHRAEMIARSEIMRVSNAVNDSIFKANDDIVKGVMWLATLDLRTCPECSALDGQQYFYEKNQKPPERPLHPQCRCIVTPILKSWKELGAKSSIAKKLDALDPGARASMTGYVPAKVRYADWFNAQPDKFKMDVLGHKRFKIYKTKKLTYDQMVKNGRWITLKDLSKFK